jgi:branched-chain amino acid transport system ATP-binding protein
VEADHTDLRVLVLTSHQEQARTPDRPAPAPIELRSVRAGYGRIEVLFGIDIAVRRGAITALLGPNGAGKTTALSVMSGLLTPTAGCRHLQGRHLNHAASWQLARAGVCHVREGRSVFPNLTVSDNLMVAAAAGTPRARIQDVAFTLFPRLSERRGQLAGTLSGGEKQMLALACGLGADPSILLIDELSMGLAPIVVAELYEAVSAITQHGVSVLVVEQFATLGLKYAEHAYVMAHGLVTYAGPSHSADEAIQNAYLGAVT